MHPWPTRITLYTCLSVAIISLSCTRPKSVDTGQQSVVLQEGTTGPNPGYFVSDKGEVVYTDNPSGDADKHNPAFPPLFPGSQRIYPANDNPQLRESYLTRAPLDAIMQFYNDFLDIRKTDYAQQNQLAENFAQVQSIELRDPEGRRQVALFVNKDEGPRGGLKVMMKEFPVQHAVQIILTTVDATPPGLNPIGTYVTPEEVEQWAKEEAARQAEEQRRREEIERQAQNQSGSGTSGSSDSGGNSGN